MTDCELNCFWSGDTVSQVLFGIVIGAIVGLFIGCLADGTIAFTDGGFTCAANIIADMWGWWLVGALIGAIVFAVLAFAECQTLCAAAAADAADNEAEQGLVDEGSEDPKDCETVRRWVELIGKAKTRTDQRLEEARRALENSQRDVRRAEHSRSSPMP